MTDQTEPKYNIGDWIETTDGRIDKITEVAWQKHSVYTGWWYNLGIPEIYIKYAVSIHPIPSVKPKCKDCEHCIPNKQEGNHHTGAHMSFDCPVYKWLYRTFSYIDVWLFTDENTEPPPNCYCFTPKGDKLSPDEKESLEQSERDFATGNVLTKDEAFEKLGWKESE